MKKIIYSAAIFALLAAFISCSSTKAAGKNAGAQEPAAAAEAAESASEKEKTGETEAADQTEKTGEAADGAKSENAKSENTKSENAKTEDAVSEGEKPAAAGDNVINASEDANFIGWIKTSRKSISEKFGIVQLKVKSKIGAYSIAVLNEKDKGVPVLTTANEFATNAFYLKNSKRVYNLVTDSNVSSSAKKNKNGATIIYDIPEVAQVSVMFSCFASVDKGDVDMIKVTASVKNMSQRADEFSLKAVLDTILGESDHYHFYTYENVAIKNEVLYRTLQNQKWFLSKNSNAAMQLFFTGADCTTPELVALANYSTLEKHSWEPDMLSYRAFDTVLSYNNSGVCAIWPAMKLGPTESGKVVFYIALAADGKSPTGEKFVYSKEFAEKPAEEKKNAESGDKALEVITPFTNPTVENLSEDPDIIAADNPVIPNVDFYIKNMTKDHLTPEYIQSLLDRIAALEESSSSLNRQELLQLNAELDAILTYLRQ